MYDEEIHAVMIKALPNILPQDVKAGSKEAATDYTMHSFDPSVIDIQRYRNNFILQWFIVCKLNCRTF